MRNTTVLLSILGLITIGCGADARDREMDGGGLGPGDGHDGGTDDGDGAGDERFDIGSANYDGGHGDDGPAGCDEDVDIVFVMDVSTSMGGFLSKLADEILVVDQAIQTLPLPSPPRYGLVVFVDDALFINTGAAYTDVSLLQADFRQWSTFTQSNTQTNGTGWNDTWPENSLDAIHLAAEQFEWRPADSTSRIIIHTTDDTFWDGPTQGNGVPIQRGYDDVVAALQGQQIRMFTFADTIGGQCQCEDVTAGWFGPYQGKPAIPNATDGGVWNINEVLGGAVSLSDAIPEAVEDKHCEPYPPPG